MIKFLTIPLFAVGAGVAILDAVRATGVYGISTDNAIALLLVAGVAQLIWGRGRAKTSDRQEENAPR